VARVVAVFDDLLLGSNVLGMLTAGGHDVRLDAAPERADADVLVVDLGSAGIDGIALVERLRAAGGERVLDVQWTTPHLRSLGARDIPRAEYLRMLPAALAAPPAFG
jgi:CheY-like chemotaxis protein